MLPMILPADFHTPVLLSEVIAALRVEKGKKYIDVTVGGGGYAVEILRRGGFVLGIDQDEEAIDHVKRILRDKDIRILGEKVDKSLNITISQYPNIYLVHGNFKDLKEIAHSNGFNKVAGIVFDLGMSTYQLEKSGRGFSYRKNELLDMRMDIRRKTTAADILNNYSKERLYEIFVKYSEELNSRAIADAIVRARSVKKIYYTSELAQLIDGFSNWRNRQNTKARIFQALRIEVNNELKNLQMGLIQAIDLLEIYGRIAVLSYHSLEDRIVKLIFEKGQKEGRLAEIAANFLKAGRDERFINPKSRSAKLRLAEKIRL